MAYLGSIPAANYKVVRKQTITGNGGTSYTLDYPVGNDQEIEVYVNNVRQEPGVAYTTAGTALTMTGIVASTDSFYVVFQGKAEQTISIPEKQNDGSYSFDSGFFFIDAPNNEIGIGTTTPTSNLHVIGTANVTSNVVIGGRLTINSGIVTAANNTVGTDGQYLTSNGSATYWKTQTITSATAVSGFGAGTFIDFTGIPSWAKRITVMFNGLSSNGTNATTVRVGSGSVQSTGYVSHYMVLQSGAAVGGSNITTGFDLSNATAATSNLYGTMTLTSLDTNNWTSTFTIARTNTTQVWTGGGAVALSGTLDRVRIASVNGTDAFDGGTVNVMWE